MSSFEEEPRQNPIVMFKQQVTTLVGFFKITSWPELSEKIIIIVGLLIFVGFVIMIGAMIGWVTLGALLGTSFFMWFVTLFWLWMFR